MSWPLRAGLLRVGRDPANELVLVAEGVSRHHCLLVAGRHQVEVVDLGSKNGTWVDGERIDRASAVAGTAIRFGAAELTLEGVAPADMELAVELVPLGTSAASAATPTPSDTLTLTGRWLALVSRFAAALGRDPDGSGLEVVVGGPGGLGVHGAAIIRAADGRDLEVVAASGQVPFERLDTLLLDSVGHGFAQQQEVTFYRLDEGRGEVWALVLAGSFDGRGRSRELLDTLLNVYRAARPTAATTIGQRIGNLEYPPGHVVGTAPSMSGLYQRLGPAARSELPVLITGETGVGKEHVARLLHHNSRRRAEPWIAINCAAIPKDLLEAELFGIGARVATGVDARKGKFLLADRGTLFLDEVGDMPAELQAKLLRVLQDSRVEPVGRQPVGIDVRVISATNTNLETRVEDGRFRRDLYYRLAGFVLEVPPLRERLEDLLPLLEHFLRRTVGELGKPVRGLTRGALRRFLDHSWPGNVRELEHVVRRLAFLCPSDQVIDSVLVASAGLGGPAPPRSGGDGFAETATFPAPVLSSAPGSGTARSLNLESLEREAIIEALRRTQGQLTDAAELLGLSRFSLRRRLERHRLDPSDL